MAIPFTLANVLAALQVFDGAPNKQAIDQANAYLSDFQHSTDAWAVANTLLLAPDAPQSARLFAAQSFRTKVTYDLNQLQPQQTLALKDTLLTALEGPSADSKAIRIQLCLALASLALQSPYWQNAVPGLLEKYGQNPTTVPILLEFLTVLPEEVNGNTKIPISNDEYRERAPVLLSSNAEKILELLVLYIQAPGVTYEIQRLVFGCLRSWVHAGELEARLIGETPLLDFAFRALGSPQLFEDAVDLICSMIHESQEIYDNEDFIQILLPRLVELKNQLASAADDTELMRGLTRIFAEAGETYRVLIIQHLDSFFPIVEAILECTSYHDLDVVPITFQFWFRLAQLLGKQSTTPAPLLQAYKGVMLSIIKHLHYAPDDQALTGQELDDFRSFRHTMGDTLKDCCYVLGPGACLFTAYDIIATALSRSTVGTISWQEIEAPIFAMRAMGGEIDPRDDQVVPKVMDLIPTLPNHPKLQYAAILLVSRYTEWLDLHPSYIPFQLNYISSGFQSSDGELSAAAAQAMKYLCKDCTKHLSDSLPQLHSFINTVGTQISQDDRIQIYEAIGHIIASLPLEKAATSMKSFAFELLSRVHNTVSKPVVVSKEELREVADMLEQLEALLRIVEPFGEDLPPECNNASTEAWSVFEILVTKYGGLYFVLERVTRVLRFGIQFFNINAITVIPSVLATFTASFQKTGLSSCMWIFSKIIQQISESSSPATKQAIRQAYDGMSLKVAALLSSSPAKEHPDIIEDYIQLSQTMVDFVPEEYFASTGVSTSFMTGVVALTLPHTDIVFASLDFLRIILTQGTPSGKGATHPMQQIFTTSGQELLKSLLTGMSGDFPEEAISAVILLFRCIADSWPTEMIEWLPGSIESMPLPLEEKTKFVTSCRNAINSQHPDRVKQAVASLFRATRKIKERREPRSSR